MCRFHHEEQVMNRIDRTIVAALAGACLANLWLCGPAAGQAGLGEGMKEERSSKKKPEQGAGPTGFKMAPDRKVHFALHEKSKRNIIKFTSKAPKETIEGKTTKFSGTLDLNPRKLDTIEGRFTIAWKDIDTGNPMRNQHMTEPPWIDAAKHPEIVFSISGIENARISSSSDKTIRADLVGRMAMNGKEKEMKIPVTLTWIPNAGSKKPGMVTEALGIKARFKIALADFGIEGKSGTVGTAVAREQDISVSAQVAAPERQLSVEEMPVPTKPKKKPIAGA